MKVKDIVLGRPLRDDEIKHQRLSRMWGLPIMASDAVSSVAYAVPEMMLVLVPAVGIAGTKLVGWIALPIIALLLILVMSYSQVINRYPNGGGAYIVSKENFGKKTSLLAASCLIVDYIMTVAVSVSSATEALTAAFPTLYSWRVLIALVCLGFVTLINLRGMSESSKLFGVPTYAFIICLVALVAAGFIKFLTGGIQPIAYTSDQINASLQMAGVDRAQYTLNSIGTAALLFMVMRAFSSGCSALTGVEAVSNAVPAFKQPSQRTAKHVLYMLGGIIIFTFGGISLLAGSLGAIELPQATIISQLAQQVFGSGFMFYAIQFTTLLILLLAANTAFNGLPILLSVLSRDKYMPRQFGQRGAKLSFSNGILFIFIAAGLLILIFQANTHDLIPFYSVGVFVSFTLSQTGMLKNWIRSKGKGWHYRMAINGLGAVLTGVCAVIVFLTKFMYGAWALLIIIPVFILFMVWVNRSYTKVTQELNNYDYHYKPSTSTNDSPCIVLVSGMNKATAKTFQYALSMSRNITPLHLSTSPAYTEQLKKKWEELKIDVPLTIVPARYRDVLTPLEEYIILREKELKSGESLTVLMTKFVVRWYDRMLHNQTARTIERKLSRHKDVVTALIPYIYGYNEETHEEQVARIEAEKAEREAHDMKIEEENRLEAEKAARNGTADDEGGAEAEDILEDEI